MSRDLLDSLFAACRVEIFPKASRVKLAEEEVVSAGAVLRAETNLLVASSLAARLAGQQDLDTFNWLGKLGSMFLV